MSMKGCKHSEETKARIRAALKNRKVTWGGKISAGKKGKPRTWESTGDFKKGCSNPTKGLKKPNITGENHWNWKGGVTAQYQRDRHYFAITISPQVFARDNYTCQICFVYGVYLHADHIKSWKEYPELKFEVSNCRTLCRPCHYYVTFKRNMPVDSKWGIANNVL